MWQSGDLNYLVSSASSERQNNRSNIQRKIAEVQTSIQNCQTTAGQYEIDKEKAVQDARILQRSLTDQFDKAVADHNAKVASLLTESQKLTNARVDLQKTKTEKIPQTLVAVKQELDAIHKRIEREQEAQVKRLEQLTESARQELEKVKGEVAAMVAAEQQGLAADQIEEQLSVGYEDDEPFPFDATDPLHAKILDEELPISNTEHRQTLYQVVRWTMRPETSVFRSGESGLTLRDLLAAVMANFPSDRTGSVHMDGQLRGQRVMQETSYIEYDSSPDYEFEIVKDVTSIDYPKLLSVTVVPKLTAE